MPPHTPIANGEPGSSDASAEDRRLGHRRAAERESAADAMDVSRIEHDNLTKQVDANQRAIRRLDTEMRRLRERLDALTSTAQERKG